MLGFPKVADLDTSEESCGPDIVIVDVRFCDQVQKLVDVRFPKKRAIQYIQLIRGQSTDELVAAFQHTNRDCLLVPFTERTLVLSIERAQERRRHIARNLRVRRRLEKTMADSDRRLSILRADQLAGRQMQQSLLPSSPIINPPYYIARKILPSLYLSGDFVNYMPALDEFFLFYLMDVSGHGASSAFITVMVRQLMRRIVRRQVRDEDVAALSHAPEGFLERINTVLHDNEIDKHLTIFTGCLDQSRNSLRYAVGAQLPMPVLISEGRAQFLQGKGRPVGMFADSTWVIEEIDLPDRFILVAFSDGILEVLPQDSLKQKEDWLLRKLAKCPADIDKVFDCLEIEVSAELPDDIAVFMLARGYHDQDHAEVKPAK